jgi:hypothetical protein
VINFHSLALAQVVLASPVAIPQSNSAVPTATISATLARFTFPTDSNRQYTWDVAGPAGYVGRPEYSWEVSWDEGLEGRGREPFAITLVVRWRAGGLRSGSLARMLEGRQAHVLVFCVHCTTPAALDHRDAAVRWSIDGNRVSFTVHGAEAVRRVFPNRPHTVTFTKRRSYAPEQEWRVPVTTRRATP